MASATAPSVILPGLTEFGSHAGNHGVRERMLPVARGMQIYQRGSG